MPYLTRRPFPALVVTILALGLLPGCGDDDDDDFYYHDDDVFIDDDLPPSCDLLSVYIDRDSREIIAEVAVIDDGEGGSRAVDLSFVLFAGGGRRIVDILDSSPSARDRIGNRLIGVQFDDDFPGAITDVRLSTITPNPLYSDPNAVLDVEVSDDHWVSLCSLEFDLRLSTEPICILQSPGSGDQTGGLVPVRIEIGDYEGDPADLTLWYSFDGGATLLPATLASTSDGVLGPVDPCDTANPAGDGVLGIPTAFGGALVTITVQWDSSFDGVGIGMTEAVALFAFVQDCFDRPALSAPPCVSYDVLVRNP